MIKGIGNVLFSTRSQTSYVQDQVVTLGESLVHFFDCDMQPQW